jgi:Tfp pilus assembly protein PilX
MKSISKLHLQSGAVSLFVVIFATLLITIVTVSFLRLMINDQNQATNNDLSQSAYDSALAGVEDAKRALLRYQAICEEEGESVCTTLGNSIAAMGCNEVVKEVLGVDDLEAAGVGQTGEVKIQQSTSEGDSKLDQAYTCVKVKLLTDDYLGTLSATESKLVPLIGKNGDGSTDFNTVTVEWFTSEDIGSGTTGNYNVSLTGAASPQPLFATSNWPTNRPPVMRAQLMQFNPAASGFTLDSFDYTSSGQSNTNTVFLYPSSASAAASESFTAIDGRKSSASGETPIDAAAFSPRVSHCESTLTNGGYACKTVFTLPEPVGGSANNRTAFLRLGALYNQTHFRVTLSKSGTATQFNGVQPEIDSTGRANTLFRRVSSRVDLIDTNFPYPDGSLDVSGNLCKDFSVTPTTYTASSSCTP